MKPMTGSRHDRDAADMTVEQIMARIRWLDAMLADLQRAMVAEANRNDTGLSAIFRSH